MRIGVGFAAHNYNDWERFEGIEAGKVLPKDGPCFDDNKEWDGLLRLGRLVEALGFDSFWAPEHHFTPYSMCSNPLQYLSYFAGCTERIDMGTMVIVTPWHDPLRVAEGIIMLDHMLAGRKLNIGLGRGVARREYDGLRIPFDQSRERFAESLDIIRLALTKEWFSYEGQCFKIPSLSMRPGPRSADLVDRMYGSWGSAGSIPVVAQSGLKPLAIPQKDWPTCAEHIQQFSDARDAEGYAPTRPIVVCWMYCSEDPAEAEAKARKYMFEFGDSSIRHYEIGKEHFEGVKGYEHYAAGSRAIRRHPQVNPSDDLAKVYVDGHVWGTPKQCIARLENINRAMGPSQIVVVPQFGSMTAVEAEQSLRVFARECLPAMHDMREAPMIMPSKAAAAQSMEAF